MKEYMSMFYTFARPNAFIFLWESVMTNLNGYIHALFL